MLICLLFLMWKTKLGLTVNLEVDVAGAFSKPIHSTVFGVNFGIYPDYPTTLVRSGGNAETRYNWELDISNSGSDWYFIQNPRTCDDPAKLPNGSSADNMIHAATTYAKFLLQVPIFAVAGGSRSKAWGFSVKKYNYKADGTECTASGNASWCEADAGNGKDKNGTMVTGNDPADTSISHKPEFVVRWLQHIKQQGLVVSRVALDNEPMLWQGTHRDIHPLPTSYDEIWNLTVKFAAAIKAYDPSIKIHGPMPWGWCAYWSSALDEQCTDGTDRQAHGGMAFLEWYVAQVAKYKSQFGVQLVDVLDIHYYAQASNVLSSAEDDTTAALRLRAVQSLSNASYVDESWINQPINLIPRLTEWISAHNLQDSMSIGVSEWAVGDDSIITAALAAVEYLAVFSREGVESANRWEAPKNGTVAGEAFRIFLNYDGKGSNLLDSRSSPAKSDSPDVISVYSFIKESNVYIYAINREKINVPVSVMVSGITTIGTAHLYQFSKSSPSLRMVDMVNGAITTGGEFNFTAPAWSATLAVASYT